MSNVYTTGSWKPFPGEEGAFIEAWTEFADWASSRPGAGVARLARDLRDPERFVSFMAWDSIEAVREWKSSPEFKERMSRVQKHIDKFAPTELELVASCGSAAPASA
ncbi:MAG TPA: antibiotic biosynthesis monooxygenase family protein [Gaiellaceae bacterium]|nr:antibiotic biosynthesis monooxygenase family protein [Gaiellaceae bacterium]